MLNIRIPHRRKPKQPPAAPLIWPRYRVVSLGVAGDTAYMTKAEAVAEWHKLACWICRDWGNPFDTSRRCRVELTEVDS